MPDFTSLDKMFDYIEKSVSKTLPQAGEIAKGLVQHIIWEKLYSSYMPTNYKRTYDFVSSIKIGNITKINGNYSVPIYYDTSLIIPEETDPGDWNIHMDIDGNSRSYELPYYLENDNPGGLWKPRQGIGAMQGVINNENREHIRILQEIVLKLEQNGFVVDMVG